MEELAELLGESPAINILREKLRHLLEGQLAGRRLPPILIQGETGTGKGLVARLVHRVGPRKDGPFVDINCPAIPETLLEAELFGYERGAFTDARRAKPGLLQTAHRGTLFLDEVGLLPESVQAKLLTVIEERVVRRLGSTRPEAVDVCFISATNTDLQAALRAAALPGRPLPPAGGDHARPAPAAGTGTRRAPPRRAIPRPSLRRLWAAAEDLGRAGAGPAARVSLAGECPGARQRDGAHGALRRLSRGHRSDAGAAVDGRAGPPERPRRRVRVPASSRQRPRCASISWVSSSKARGTSRTPRPGWASRATRSMRASRSTACAAIVVPPAAAVGPSPPRPRRPQARRFNGNVAGSRCSPSPSRSRTGATPGHTRAGPSKS